MAHSEVIVPDMGSDDPVDVIEISVKQGDQVEAEQTLLVLESAKATVEVPAPMAGEITEVCTEVGKQVKQGDLIFKMSAQAEGAQSPQSADEEPSAGNQPSAIKEPSTSEKPSTGANQHAKEIAHVVAAPHAASEGTSPTTAKPQHLLDPAPSTPDGKPIHAGPAVRRLANQLGVDLSKVSGSGPKKRILKEDVHGFVKKELTTPSVASHASAAPMPKIDFSQWGEVEPLAMTKIQSLSAKNLQRAWQVIPHVTQFDEADITALEAFRKQENASLKQCGVKLTLLAFIIKASVQALKIFPKFCASFDEEDNQIILKKYYHIGFAADTDNGLVVPVIRDANLKSVIEIANDLADMSERARAKKLKPQEMQGGCFTISSLGGIGGTAFTPIVNWPEVAILGVSRSQNKVVMEGGQYTNQLTLPLSLSYDHRVIDGADAARFTAYLASLLSDIRRALL